MPLYISGNPMGPSEPSPLSQLAPIPTPFTPIFLESGYRHHFISGATPTGTDIYAFGTGEAHRLGLDDDEDRAAPCVVPNLRNKTVSRIACGREHSIFLLSTGKVFGCGWGEVR